MDNGTLLWREMKRVGAGLPQLRVLTWNVLSDQLSGTFPKVPENILEWTHREPLIKAELLRADADLLCLQEVDHFDSLSTFLSLHGYSGVYQQKTDWHRDGTAIFYRTSLLDLEAVEKVTFWKRSQNYVLMRLTHKRLGIQFVVVATHLKSYQKYENTRVLQVAQILGHIAKSPGIPVILAGDLNALPLCPVYNLLSATPLGFRSAYWNNLRPEAEPAFTCIAYREELERRTLDYIWVKGWTPCAVMTIPTEEKIGECGLPCWKYPSDHIALVCDLALPTRL